MSWIPSYPCRPWRAASLTELLPRCDAVITHGGYGSIMACLSAGVAMVVLPLGEGDQAGNAHRCAALGVARVLPADQRTPDDIRAAVREVLADACYREHARQVQEQIRSLPGLEYAIRLLEHLAAGGVQPAALP